MTDPKWQTHINKSDQSVTVRFSKEEAHALSHSLADFCYLIRTRPAQKDDEQTQALRGTALATHFGLLLIKAVDVLSDGTVPQSPMALDPLHLFFGRHRI